MSNNVQSLWFCVFLNRAGIVAWSPRPFPVTKFWHEYVCQQLVPHPIQHHADPFSGLQVNNNRFRTKKNYLPEFVWANCRVKWGWPLTTNREGVLFFLESQFPTPTSIWKSSTPPYAPPPHHHHQPKKEVALSKSMPGTFWILSSGILIFFFLGRWEIMKLFRRKQICGSFANYFGNCCFVL